MGELAVWIRPHRRAKWVRFAVVANQKLANDVVANRVPNHSEVFVCEADRDVNAEEAEGRARERRRHAAMKGKRNNGDPVG
jgi:hypothetical protein